MRNFLVYDLATGAVKYTISPADGTLYDGLDTLGGDGIIEVEEHPEPTTIHRLKVINGTLFDAGEPPTVLHTWSVAEAAWVVDLPYAREKTREVVKARRDAKVVGGFLYLDVLYASDDISQARIQGAVQLALMAKAALAPYAVTWITADNSTVLLDADAVLGLGLTLGQHVQGTFAEYTTLVDQIAATEDVLELMEIIDG